MSFAFNFEPMSDEELNRVFLLPDGEYDFSVHDFQLRTSKAGNAMIELQIRILEGNVTHTIFDYLVNTPKSQYKVKNFCYAVGKEAEYNAGHLNPDRSWLGVRGKCKVVSQAGNPKPDGSGNYSDKNIVLDYVRRGENELDANKPSGLVIPQAAPKNKGADFKDDLDIPF